MKKLLSLLLLAPALCWGQSYPSPSINTLQGISTGTSSTLGTNPIFWYPHDSNGNESVFIGAGAGLGSGIPASTRNFSVGVGNLSCGGQGSGMVGTGTVENTCIGGLSLANLTTGSANTAVGVGAERFETTGSSNTAIGQDALQYAVGAANTVAIGPAAAGNVATPSQSVAIGVNAMQGALTSSPSQDIFIGVNAGNSLAMTTPSNDVFIGQSSGGNIVGASNVTAVGYNAGLNITSGGFNTLYGYFAGKILTSGANNVIIGHQVASTTLQTGSNNLLIGFNTGCDTAASNTSNYFALCGNSGPTLSATGTNTASTMIWTMPGSLTLPNVTTGTNADFLCLSSGGVVLLQSSACTISSARFKEDIQPLGGNATDELLALNVSTFKLRDGDKNGDPNASKTQVGLIAEDVAKVDPRLAIYEDDMKTPKSYRQESVIALLVKAVQEQQAEIEALKKKDKSRHRRTH
jgi:hypothetical protein